MLLLTPFVTMASTSYRINKSVAVSLERSRSEVLNQVEECLQTNLTQDERGYNALKEKIDAVGKSIDQVIESDVLNVKHDNDSLQAAITEIKASSQRTEMLALGCVLVTATALVGTVVYRLFLGS